MNMLIVSFEFVMQRKGFGDRWIPMCFLFFFVLVNPRCLSICNISVIVNINVGNTFRASEELRQGDLLSPSLFILVAGVLVKLIDKAQETELVDGFVIKWDKICVSLIACG